MAVDSPNQTLSVTEFNTRVKSVLEGTLRYVRVEGELSQINQHGSGHVYLTLKDPNSRLQGVVWKSVAQRLRYKPNIGEQVVVYGSISVYVPHGSYKLVINSIEPAGLGARQAAFEALKAKLLKEGLFESENKRDIPLLPRGVGVITSPTGAARRDIESVIFRRSPQVKIVLYPAIVQGAAAASDLVLGLQMMNQRSDIDLIIIGRGGGSIEDLWAFNEERVARAIAKSTLPVISAVGHETDTTISDMVADRRAPTPSVAGEVAVPVRDDLLYTISLLSDRMNRNLEHRLERNRSQLENYALRIENQIDISGRHQRFESIQRHLDRLLAQHIQKNRQRLHDLEIRVRHQAPHVRAGRSREALTAVSMRLRHAGNLSLDRGRSDLKMLAARLSALSPLSVLERGFSVARKDHAVIRSHTQVEVGDEISILLHEGSIGAKVCDKSQDRSLELASQEVSS